MTRLILIIAPAATFAALLAVWHVAGANASVPGTLPMPLDIGRAALELMRSGTLLPAVGASLRRFGVGYAAAVCLAVPLGVAFGRHAPAWAAFDPLVQVLRPISPIAWFPLFSLWFGIGELPAVVIIFMAAFYPMLLATIAAVRGVDPSYLRMSRNFGTGPLRTLIEVVLPAALPGITVGLRIALGTAWVFLVAGEMLGVQSGLGFLIIDARNSLRTDLVIVGMIAIGLLGFMLDRLLRAAETTVRRGWGPI